MTSYFQDGGHDVRPHIGSGVTESRDAAMSAGFPLARRVRERLSATVPDPNLMIIFIYNIVENT